MEASKTKPRKGGGEKKEGVRQRLEMAGCLLDLLYNIILRTTKYSRKRPSNGLGHGPLKP